MDAIKRKRAIGYDRRNFSFTHMRNVREITDNLSNNQCGYLMLLQPYIQFKSNVLVGKKEKPLDMKGITKALGVSQRTAKTTIDGFINDGIIDITKEGYYIVNDRYHFRRKAGSDKNMVVKTFFSTLKDLKLKTSELGALYKLLPYVHYETNIICADPFEEVPANIRFLNKKEIAKIMGVHEKKALQIIRSLRRAGAVAETDRYSDDLRVKFLTLNPYIFFRQSGQPNASLQATFLAEEYKR